MQLYLRYWYSIFIYVCNSFVLFRLYINVGDVRGRYLYCTFYPKITWQYTKIWLPKGSLSILWHHVYMCCYSFCSSNNTASCLFSCHCRLFHISSSQTAFQGISKCFHFKAEENTYNTTAKEYRARPGLSLLFVVLQLWAGSEGTETTAELTLSVLLPLSQHTLTTRLQPAPRWPELW